MDRITVIQNNTMNFSEKKNLHKEISNGDKHKLFQIGDIARLFHLSVSSIRHYEKLGLLTPEYTDPDSGYRYFSQRQFEVFNTIRYLRALDMPLSEITDFLKNRDIDNIADKLLQQKEAVIKKQEELKRIERKIDNRLRQIIDARDSKLYHIELIELPEARILKMEQSLKINSYDDMEMPTVGLAEDQSNPLVFIGKVGLSITKEHLLSGYFNQYDTIFLIIDDEDDFSGNASVLPRSTAVRIRFNGSHIESPAEYQKLIDYINEKGLSIDGPSREMTLIDYGLTNNTDKFVTEICIPVK